MQDTNKTKTQGVHVVDSIYAPAWNAIARGPALDHLMDGPEGDTQEIDIAIPSARKTLTIFDAQQAIADKAAGRAWSLNVAFSMGRYLASVEYAGGGFSCGVEATGTGADMETAVLAAINRLPGVADV